ncbi:MAG TPA: ABC transporter ATP-binding protein [Thermoanaerobaculia bacterium]|nr:ABC transporter ATP-binding protein [Thermoanaerobaculia bacterium]
MIRLEPSPSADLVGVTHRYGKVTALAGVDLALAPGQITALLGPNGAGKTTIVKLLLGLLKPQAGRVRLFGGDPAGLAARRRAGAMMQVGKVPETLKVREHLELFRAYYPAPSSLAELVERAGLGGLEERLFGRLSGGQKQRLLFALALAGNPDVLFLDEPTVGLDVEARRALWGEIRRLRGTGKTILLTTHYLEEADSLADRVVVLRQGSIVADGSPAEIKTRALLRRVGCSTVLNPAEVGRWSEVRSLDADGTRLSLLTPDAEALVRRLLAADPRLADLEVTSAGLEEAFLVLTRDAVKGAA